MGEDTMAPITVDKHGHIVNGHHRYDALRLMGEEYATVRMIDVHVSETLDENFADGKPKKKTNEGYKLQLERDTDMMVLNIVDTATGKRTEVRGKPG